MLVGGGAEDENGWSNTPYQWVVQQSVNKKVAVISYQQETEFIPTYFKGLGAVESKNIKIDSKSNADLQATYDELMQFDVFFFKGGDQSYYYNYFKSTKTELAIRDKFNSGGVISGTSAGMAILSEVLFTAEKSSVYPDEILEDYTQPSITLKNDFLNLLPGFIVDSHFTERGRCARLLGFMANWYTKTHELLIGVGVDDRTALCIDANKIGTVYGTGSVSIYTASSFSSYEKKKLVADRVQASQLLNGHRIDLNDLSILTGPESVSSPIPEEEKGDYVVLLSGTNALAENTLMLDELIGNTGKKDDTVILVTSGNRAKNFASRLTEMKAPYFVLETIDENNREDKISLRNKIKRTNKILFAENDWQTLSEFMNDGATGKLLKTHLTRKGIISAFVGQDSRLAGKVFVANNLIDPDNAYYGKLQFEQGIGLLATSLVMPDAFNVSSTTYYENNTAGVSFGLINSKVSYGIYLNRSSYLKFYQIGNTNYFSASGELSTLVLVNEGTKASNASQPVNETGAVRNYVGFRDMHFTILNGDAKMKVGSRVLREEEPYTFEEIITSVRQGERFNVLPNPSETGKFLFQFGRSDLQGQLIQIYNSKGQLIKKYRLEQSEIIVDLMDQASGMYIAIFGMGKIRTQVRLVKP